MRFSLLNQPNACFLLEEKNVKSPTYFIILKVQNYRFIHHSLLCSIDGSTITLICKQVRKAVQFLTSKLGMVCFFPRGASKNNCSLAPVLTCKSFPIKHMTYILYVNIEDFILQKQKRKVSLTFLLLTALYQFFFSIGKNCIHI